MRREAGKCKFFVKIHLFISVIKEKETKTKKKFEDKNKMV